MERDESAGNVTAVVAVLAPAAGAVSNKDKKKKKKREKAAPGPADVLRDNNRISLSFGFVIAEQRRPSSRCQSGDTAVKVFLRPN